MDVYILINRREWQPEGMLMLPAADFNLGPDAMYMASSVGVIFYLSGQNSKASILSGDIRLSPPTTPMAAA
jgi:hypothetical protein